MGREPCIDLSHIAKYKNRNSPSANSNWGGCRGIITLGNDGRLYKSVNRSNNVHTWQLLCSKSRPCTIEPLIYFDRKLDTYSDDYVYLKKSYDGELEITTTTPSRLNWWMF